MTNANKAKGDRAEAAVRDEIVKAFPASWRTRAGWDEDRGDIVLDLLGTSSFDRTGVTYAIQVKDVGSPSWSEWFSQLSAQIHNGGHRGGVIWWKLRGKANPLDWRVVMTGSQYLGLMARMKSLEAALAAATREGE